MSNELQVVYLAGSAEQAHLLAGALRDRGVEAVVENEALRLGLGGLPFGMSTAPRVMVRGRDSQQARQIVLELTGETEAPPRRMQFRLSTLLLGVTAVCVLLGIGRVSNGRLLRDASHYLAMGLVLASYVAAAVLAFRMVFRRRRGDDHEVMEDETVEDVGG
jgi:hypothetical protein